MFRPRYHDVMVRQNLEREMDNFIGTMIESTSLTLTDIKDRFLEQFPEEEGYFEEFVTDFMQ